MFCTKCGSEIEDGATFCTNCGAPQSVQAEPEAVSSEPPIGPAPIFSDPYVAPEVPPAEPSSSSRNNRKIALIIGVIVVALVIAAVAVAFAGGLFAQSEEKPSESSVASGQSQDAASIPIEDRTIVTDHFTFVMPESWVDAVTWTMDYEVYPSPTGKGSDQELFFYSFYLVDGDRSKDQVMDILVTNDATGQLGQTALFGEFTTGAGLEGYICSTNHFLAGENVTGANYATIASLQSGGQVQFQSSDSAEKRKADLQTIETWMKENVVSQITPSSSPASASDAADLGFKGITNVRASSTLPTDDINTRDYSATSLIDGDEWTCWCENVPGVGIDEYVAFSGPGEQTFHGFKIRNGHQSSIQLYYKNARATSLRVIVDGEVKETVQLADEGLNWQEITFAQPYSGKEISLQIASAESGSSYDDCCISEVEFF